MSRRRTLYILTICAVFVAIGVLLVRRGSTSDRIVGWFELAFFGLGLLVIGWTLVSPPRLALCATDLRLSGNLWHRPTERDWLECGEFRARRIGAGLGRPTLVVYQTNRTNWRGLRSLNRAIVGGDESIAAGFGGLSAGELAQLLNRYRRLGDRLIARGSQGGPPD